MNRQHVQEVVFRNLHQLVPGTAEREIDPAAPLNEIGVDSLDLVDVASRSMQELSVKIPRSEVARIRTLNDLVTVLEELVRQSTGTVAA